MSSEQTRKTLWSEKPPMINSEFCDIYADADKGECNPNCPFYAECTPWFEELAQALERNWEMRNNV
jgi:hypothetical protein